MLIYLHRVPNPQTVRDIEEDFIMGVTYIIAIVAAVVLLALNLIRDYGKKGGFTAFFSFVTHKGKKSRAYALLFLR